LFLFIRIKSTYAAISTYDIWHYLKGLFRIKALMQKYMSILVIMLKNSLVANT